MKNFKFPKLMWRKDGYDGYFCDTPTGKRIVIQHYDGQDYWCGDAGDSYGRLLGLSDGYNTPEDIMENMSKVYWDSQRSKYERSMEFIRMMHGWSVK